MALATEPQTDSAMVQYCRRYLHPLLAVWSAACFLALIGWVGEITAWLHWLTVSAGFVFVVERTWLLWAANAQGNARYRMIAHQAVAVAVLGVSLLLLVRDFSGESSRSIGWHAFIQLGIFASGMASIIHRQNRFTARTVNPGLLLIGSFFGIIVVGTLLLKMPLCVLPGKTCSWLDAAFTSTSAVCVTGLNVQNTVTFFSQTGQVVILLLIQVGGLGIMTLTFFAAVVLFEGLSLHDRLLLGRMISENRLSRVGTTLKFIVIFTFVCEGIGALVLFAGLNADVSWQQRAFHSVFHAVSAFCNAGFSTFTDNLASSPLQGNGIWQSCIMLLIVIGGLGSLVVEDVCQWFLATCRKLQKGRQADHRLRVHSRVVLLATGVLVFGGALAMLVSEFVLWNGPENSGKFLTAMFHSVTARTAGFNTVSMSAIGPMTVNILMILMLIGGSPGGTAGGVRTTVFAVALGHLWIQLRSGKRDMVAFNRTIPADTGSQALGLIFLAGIWLTGNFMVFQLLEAGKGFSDSRLLFELISAFATVGLSIDLTPLLSDGGKSLLIVNMFVGRIGLLTVMATFIPPDTRPVSGKPREDILLN